MNRLFVQVQNGKYSLIQNEDGSLSVQRYGKPWRDVTGDNFILCMAQEIALLREGLEILKVAVNDKQPDPGAVMFIEGLLGK